MVHYYDKVIGSIGLLLLGGAVTSFLISPLVVPIFGIIAGLLIAHAIFINPPVDEKGKENSEYSDSGSAPVAD